MADTKPTTQSRADQDYKTPRQWGDSKVYVYNPFIVPLLRAAKQNPRYRDIMYALSGVHNRENMFTTKKALGAETLATHDVFPLSGDGRTVIDVGSAIPSDFPKTLAHEAVHAVVHGRVTTPYDEAAAYYLTEPAQSENNPNGHSIQQMIQQGADSQEARQSLREFIVRMLNPENRAQNAK